MPTTWTGKMLIFLLLLIYFCYAWLFDHPCHHQCVRSVVRTSVQQSSQPGIKRPNLCIHPSVSMTLCTHSPFPLYINSFIHSFNQSFNHSFILSFIYSIISSSTYPPTHPSVRPSIPPSIHLSIHPSVQIFILFIDPFIYLSIHGARCSSVIRAFAHDADPLSYFLFQPVLHDWNNKGRGMYYPDCGMVHTKEPLLLIGKSSP